MRVAHLLRKYDAAEWGGTETAIARLVAGLRRHAVDSVVFAPRLLTAAAGPDPLAQAGTVVRRFRAVLPVWGLARDQRQRQQTAVGGNVLSFDLPLALGRERGLDVVHAHALGRLGALGRLVARLRRLPLVLSVHGGAYDLPATVRQDFQRAAAAGWDWGRLPGFLLRARQLFDAADAIITCNPREADLIRARHPGRRVFVQPHAVPLEVFTPDRRGAAHAAFPWLRGGAILLVPGRIDPTKNQAWLVEQAAELRRRHPQLRLVLAGPCTHREYGEALQARLARADLQDVVRLIGALPPEDPRLVGLFQEARAVVLPSISETFGLVMLEAWAAGTPVVASRTSGATALVEEGVNGRLFDLEAPASFHAAVDEIMAHPETSRQWGAAGRARVAAAYDATALAGQMKRIYEEVSSEKAHGHTAR